MMRKLITALLLSATALAGSSPALAQDEPEGRERGGFRAERPDLGARAGEGMAERGGGWRAERAERRAMDPRTNEPMADRGVGGWSRPAPPPSEVRPAAVPPSSAGTPNPQWRGEARAAPAERAAPGNGWQSPAQAEVNRQGWRGRWENGAPQGGTASAAPAARPERGAAGGGWQSGETRQRPEWRGNEGARDQAWRQRRDEAWRGNEAQRREDEWRRDRDWRDGNARDQGRAGETWRDRQWDRPAPRYNYDRRLSERNRWQEQRRWNDDWRGDRRYNWWDHRRSYASVYRLPPYRAPYGWSYGYRRFSIGIFLSNTLFASSYWINDPFYYRLPPAYGTLRWVRYYDDALLIDVRDGYVVDVVYDVFW